MIDIILPVYKPSSDIGKTINSVLNQTYDNFKLFIINDSNEDISKYFTNFSDDRIKIFNLEANYGIAYALWYGCSKSTSKYIGRIDDGDTWHPEKLLIQITFLENNTDYALCGTQAILVNSTTNINTNFPLTDSEIRYKIERARSCLIHTSIIFKNIKVNYNKNVFGSEDMELYKRLLKIGKFNIINQYLVNVKISRFGITGNNWHSIMLSHIFLQLGFVPENSKKIKILLLIFKFLHFPLYYTNLINKNFPFKKIILPLLSIPYLVWQLSKIFKGKL